MKEYIVDFGSFIVEAKSEQDAYEKAREYVRNGEVEIDIIQENK